MYSAITAASTFTLLIAGVATSAFAASDKMMEFQRLCDPHGTAPVSTNVPCLNALVHNSNDPFYNPADPATAIFLLDSAKIIKEVQQKRVADGAAKQRFLRLLMALEDRHRVDVQAAQAREDAELNLQHWVREAADRARNDAALEEQREAAVTKRDARLEQQHQEEQEQQRKDTEAQLVAQEVMARKQQRVAAVQFCIAQAQERSEYAFNAPSECESNPNYYQTVLRLPKQTNCHRFGNEFNCTSQ